MSSSKSIRPRRKRMSEPISRTCRRWSVRAVRPDVGLRLRRRTVFGAASRGASNFGRGSQLSLVEPVEIYRQQAAERVRQFSAQPVRVWPAMPSDLHGCFDLVLANHCLYYVADLETTVSALLRGLSSPGLFLCALAGQENCTHSILESLLWADWQGRSLSYGGGPRIRAPETARRPSAPKR